jgi:trigger factor
MKRLRELVARGLSNQDEIKRLSEQIMSEKMINLYKESSFKTKSFLPRLY